jgi:O-antigen/teichoic acid export membrane protein
MSSRLLRLGTLIVTAQVLTAVLGILALRLFTDLVTPAVFGEFNLVASALGLGLQLFVAGFTASQLRFYSEAEARGAGDQFARETMIWALRSTAALSGVSGLVLLALHVTARASYPSSVILGGIAWLFAMTIRNVLMSHIQAQRQQAAYARLQVGEAILVFGATLAALRLSPTVAAFLWGQTLAIVSLVCLILALRPGDLRILTGGFANDNPSGTNAFGAAAFSYGAPFAPMSFLSWLANLGDRYTLGALMGAAAAGRYVAPFSIASRGMLLANAALCDLFRPILFAAENRDDERGARDAFVQWLLSSLTLSATGVAVVYFGGSWIVRLLLAPEYRPGAVAIMLWVSMGYTVSGITQVIESRLLSLGHSARLLLPMLLGAVANVGFSIVLIGRQGIIGAAEATCASFVCQSAATAAFLVEALRRRRARFAREAKIEPA